MTPSPEALSLAHDLKREFQALTLHHTTGEEYQLPIDPQWVGLPGRSGTQVFHVPHPREEEVPYLTVFITLPGTAYSGSHMDTSRLLVILEGTLTCNGVLYTPGQCLYLAPGEPNNWSSLYGALGVVRYSVPPPDIPEDLLPLYPYTQ